MPSSRVLGVVFLTLTLFAVAFFLFHSDDSFLNAQAENPNTQNTFTPAENYNLSVFSPIPKTLDVNPEKVALGQKLFFDPALSQNEQVSCASCHNIAFGGTDGKAKAVGINQQVSDVNTPTVFNAVFNFSQNWNGSAASLKEQALGPLFNSREMGNPDEKTFIDRIRKLPHYAEEFNEVYQSAPTLSNITDALEAFQKTLITPNSKFDLYLSGDYQALDTVEIEGLQLFKNLGCVSCHNGINLGGNMYQTSGIFKPISEGNENSVWPDRYKLTQEESDRNMMKVPTLRNIVATAPYFHDGSVSSLKKAIQIMGQAQLGKELSEEQIYKIERFFQTLTGEYLNRPLKTTVARPSSDADEIKLAHQTVQIND